VRFEDDADVGDLYTPAPRSRPCRFQLRGVRRTHRGPLRGEIALQGRVVDPEVGRAGGDVELTLRLVLDAGTSFVRVEVEGQNRRSDHRLRIVFGTDIVSPEVWADAAFGPIMRTHITPSADETVSEHAPPTAPLHRYVSLFSAARGASVLSDGLAEYEARDDGTIAITLVRGVGELSKNDLPERPGHAGWPAATPGAQCLGPFAATFAIMLHGARDAATIDAIERAADDVLLPLAGSTLRSALAVPDAVLGPELVGPGLAVSAIKESENGEWLVLRCVNLLNASTRGSWRLPFAIADAQLARLDETPLSAARIVGSEVVVDAGPRAIVTILVR
jgi:mannosylglycerate hydrolase